jgi:hypothetical protein
MRRVVLAGILSFALLLSLLGGPASAHDGSVHLPPDYEPHSGRADEDPVTSRDVIHLAAELMDAFDPRWREREHPQARDNCVYNLPNGGPIETDVCDLWEHGMWNVAGAQPNSQITTNRTIGGCPTAPVGSQCMNPDVEWQRHYAYNWIRRALIDNGMLVYSNIADDSPESYQMNSTNADHVRTDENWYTGTLDFGSGCVDFLREAYLPGGGPLTCRHGHIYQIYPDVAESAGSWIGYPSIARLSYPDMRVVEPWSTISVVLGKWNPISTDEQPFLGGSNMMTLAEYEMAAGRTWCAWHAPTGATVQPFLEVSDECWQEYWVDRNVEIFGGVSYWDSNRYNKRENIHTEPRFWRWNGYGANAAGWFFETRYLGWDGL